MQVITIFQDHKNNISKFKDHYDDIIALKKIIGDQNCILEANGDIMVKNYIGTLSSGQTNIQILPKIYTNAGVNSKKEVRDSLAFVYRLLNWSGYLKFKQQINNRYIEEADSLLEILIRILIDGFLYHHRKNVYREYVEVTENLLYIKGRIDFQKTFRVNHQINFGKVVQYDELTINNLINQIFKSAFLLLLPHTVNYENRKMLHLCVSYLEDVDTISLQKDIFNLIHFTRINEEYKPLLDLIQVLCQRQQPGLSAGGKPIISFTLQLNLLFEYFVRSLLIKVFPKPNIVNYQNGKYLAKDSDGKHHFRLVPDFIIGEPKEPLFILDSKFKTQPTGVEQLTISSSDLYQMCTYSICFDCYDIILVYPLMFDQEYQNPKSFFIENNSNKIKLSGIFVPINNEDLNEITNSVKSQLETIISSKV